MCDLAILSVPRLISRDIFFIEENGRGHRYVREIHFATHCAKKERVVSCPFVMPRCIRCADRSALSDATATSRRRSCRASASPDGRVSCEWKPPIVDRQTERKDEKRRQLISSTPSAATLINLIQHQYYNQSAPESILIINPPGSFLKSAAARLLSTCRLIYYRYYIASERVQCDS